MKTIKYIVALISFCSLLSAQNGTMEADNGVIIGNNSGTEAGTVRWTGTDFEGYDGSQWISLTLASLLSDADGDTRIDIEGDGDNDKVFIISENDTIGLLTKKQMFLGENSGLKAKEGDLNMSFGHESLKNLKSGISNTVIGYNSMNESDSSSLNIALGTSVMTKCINSWYNIGIGYTALALLDDGDNNIAIGPFSGFNAESGSNNIWIGFDAGRQMNSSSSENVVIGYKAGHGGILQNITRSIMIGSHAGGDNKGDSTILIGNYAGFNQEENNVLFIENSAADSSGALIYGKFDTDRLRFNAQTEVHKNSAAGKPQLLLKEYGADGARIIMDNDQNDNYWTIFGRPYTSAGSSQINFHYQDQSGLGAQTGNKFRIYGDGDAFLYHASNGATGAGLRLINGDLNTQYWRLYTAEGNGDLRFYSDDFATSARAWIDDATGAYSMSSDERVKNNITSLPSILNRTLQLKPSSYWYNGQSKDENKSLGFLAQEANKLFPELVSYQEDDDMYGINYAGFSVVAIKAIQEQQEMIQRHQASIQEQKDNNEQQQERIATLSSIVSDQETKIEMLINQNIEIIKALGQK